MWLNFIIIAQFIVLVLNIVVFCYLTKENDISFKLERALLLIAISIGAVLNFGKVTAFTILFSFTPFVTLINISKDGKFYQYFKRVINNIRGNGKPMEKL